MPEFPSAAELHNAWNTQLVEDTIMVGPAEVPPGFVSANKAVKKRPRKTYSDDNMDPIQEIYGLGEPQIISPVEATKFIQAQGLAVDRQFALANPKTLVGIEVEVENILRIDPNIPLMFWVVKEDGSLRNRGREFVTPGAIPVSMVEPALKQLFAGLNQDIDFSNRTSIHVHMDVRQLSLQQLVGLTLVYATVENLLFKFAGNNRRSNIFCVPITETGVMEAMSLNPKKFMYAVDGSWTKYTAFNLLPITTQGSIEFRHMPGTSNVNKLVAWVDMMTRLKQFVYKYPYEMIVPSILQLNSNSMYKQWVESIFGDMTVYLDMANLLQDMEKPVWLAKNCATANSFNTLVETKPSQDSQVGKLLGAWMKKLKPEQIEALKEFSCYTHVNDLEALFRQLIGSPNDYRRVYSKHTDLIDRILGVVPKEVAKGVYITPPMIGDWS